MKRQSFRASRGRGKTEFRQGIRVENGKTNRLLSLIINERSKLPRFARNQTRNTRGGGGGGGGSELPEYDFFLKYLFSFILVMNNTFTILWSNCCSLTSRIVKPEYYFFGQEAIAPPPPPPDENFKNCTGMVLLI